MWFFATRDVFALATAARVVGSELETQWARLWLAAVDRGHAWSPTADLPVRVALELEVLSSSSDELPPAFGGLALLVAPDDGPPESRTVFFLSQRLLGRGTGLGGAALETAWARLWLLGVSRGAVVADVREPTLRFEICIG